MIKSKTKRWVRYVACKGEKKNVYSGLVGNLKEKNTWKTQG
jgi:hypothetical protein